MASQRHVKALTPAREGATSFKWCVYCRHQDLKHRTEIVSTAMLSCVIIVISNHALS